MKAVAINRLVVIDDDVEDISLLSEILVDLCASAKCQGFSDPCTAIETLGSKTGDAPQLVIIDFYMPSLNGLECLKQLKQMDHLGETRFVVLSAMDLPVAIANVIQSLGATLVRKPNSYGDLQAIMRRLISAG